MVTQFLKLCSASTSGLARSFKGCSRCRRRRPAVNPFSRLALHLSRQRWPMSFLSTSCREDEVPPELTSQRAMCPQDERMAPRSELTASAAAVSPCLFQSARRDSTRPESKDGGHRRRVQLRQPRSTVTASGRSVCSVLARSSSAPPVLAFCCRAGCDEQSRAELQRPSRSREPTEPPHGLFNVGLGQRCSRGGHRSFKHLPLDRKLRVALRRR